LFVSALVVVPGVARAQSNGVPPIQGNWTGKLTDVYWDQTSPGSVHPKKRFSSNVDVTISQAGDQVTLTINFQDLFPVNSAAGLAQLVLDGYAGNYHVNAAMGAGPSVTLSGWANKTGTRLTLNGVIASTEFTHEVVLKLKLLPST
jgi:hypothetical protein